MSVPETPAVLFRTPLHALHIALGAKMVPFAGYELPLHYAAGVVREHLHTRAAAGLFDVSHMGQIRLTGNLHALERLCPLDMSVLRPGQQRYTFFTNESGGILDDLMVSRVGDHLVLIVNASRKQIDAAHLRQHLANECIVEELSQRALLALQGPAAAAVLARLAPDCARLLFMTGAWFAIAGAECYVTRSGYTGEDGFELSVPADKAESLARALLAHAEVAPIGLGARDSLRLEAGMCLYGHDIDTATTPIEANLAWAIAKSRRVGVGEDGFPGAENILAQLRNGVACKRMGLMPDGKIPVREGAQLQSADRSIVGRVTSGGFSPTLNRPIAIGYVNTTAAIPGSMLTTTVRDKPITLRVVHLPFVTPRYHRG